MKPILFAAMIAVSACAPPPEPDAQALPAQPVPARAALDTAETLYGGVRTVRDVMEMRFASGSAGVADKTGFPDHLRFYNLHREKLADRLAAIDSGGLVGDDARALRIMRRTLEQDLAPITERRATELVRAETEPDCGYDAHAIAQTRDGLDSLRKRLYACYGWAQSHVVVKSEILEPVEEILLKGGTLEDRTLSRLSVLGHLARIDDPVQRQRLFLSLDPVWRSINGDNQRSSPYRQLIALEAKQRRDGESTVFEQARASGIPPHSLEPWLMRMLETWRSVTSDSLIEPWDWYYMTGRVSRALSPRIRRDSLVWLTTQVYRALGADPDSLGICYNMNSFEGKTPVAYTTFAGRPRYLRGSWQPTRALVVATYETGGLDNLNELLHETGHAVHISAIRTRPAFADWPDSDPFTEAVADFMALEVYEPVWQKHWLGDSVPLADGLRGRYGGIVLDVAWALFELQMLRDPTADPNQVWTRLTREYLGIRPHPELSWWAMRGQLVDAPGYMMNYAVGAILIAAIRARTRALHRPFVTGDPTWYGWIAPRLFRFGLERPSRQVIEEFLGGPVSPEAILADMRRTRE